MNKRKILGFLLSLLLVMSSFLGLAGGALAQDGTEGKLEMGCAYPVQSDVSGQSFSYDISLKWTGADFKTFNIKVSGQPGWTVSVQSPSTTKAISAVGLSPTDIYGEIVTVQVAPLAGEFPDPGDYVFTMEASADGIVQTLDLKAVVTALYRYAYYTSNGMVSTKITAGEKNKFAIEVANTGTEPIAEITLNSTKPSGWSITFEPTDKINNLQPGIAQVIEAVIQPPRETIAGDYMVTFQASSSGLAKRSFDLRVTVLTPTVLGWVGIAIVLAVIAGLAFLFRRLGRR